MVIVLHLIMGAICAYINKQKGYSALVGFLAGALLGIIGLILVLVSKRR